MVFPLHKIVDYALTKPNEFERALHEFFPSEDEVDQASEEIRSYFIEWLIFEYKQTSSATFLAEYVLKNPDLLDGQTISQFRQIAETQWYSDFQIIKIRRGSHIKIEDVFTGKKYDVFDKLGSENLTPEGLIN